MFHGHRSIQPHSLRHAWNMTRHAHSALSRHSATGEKIVGQLAQTVEVGAGALAMGALNGFYLAKKGAAPAIMGVPVDLGVGVLLQGLAFAGLAGKQGEHLHNFADGALAAFLTKMGAGFGAKLGGKTTAFLSVSGELPRHGGMPGQHLPGSMGRDASPLSNAELYAMAHSARG
jgi:hypothetical protein